MYDVVIIGAGASGLIASITAKLNNKKVLLIEKNKTIGKKILMTGNGRGNFTNLYLTKDDYNNSSFVAEALKHFSHKKTLDFFYNLGIPYVTEKEEGRCYPASQQASSIVDSLEEEINRLNIDLIFDKEVSDLKRENNTFIVFTNDNKSYKTKNIILSTGGLTYPVTGSTGDGYKFSLLFGHKTTDLYQGLTRIHLDYNFKLAKGVKITNTLNILVNNQIKCSFYGDIIFTNSGISGIASFALAKEVNRQLKLNNKTEVSIELSNLSKNELLKRFKIIDYKTIFNSLKGLMPKKLIPLFLKYTKIENFDKLVKDFNNNELNTVIENIKNFKFNALKTDGFENSQITIGGINLNEVNNKTLESKLVKGLYFCGEILDIDSKSGGFNLQWAWSSGYLAGLLL